MIEDKSIYYSPEQINEYQNRLERDEMELELLRSDIVWMMSDARGRRIANWILRVTDPYANHFDSDPIVMSHKIGKSYLGSQLHQAIMSKCPQLFIQMMNEYNSAQNSLKRSLKNGN